tara:strand:- start:598 stop:1680 length:1083 start_codon:yes stop_codon:yes gene_type:complete
MAVASSVKSIGTNELETDAVTNVKILDETIADDKLANPKGRNHIINGNMQVAQRNTSFTSGSNNDDAYTLDRFYILSDGNDIIDVTQSTEVPSTALNSIALDVETVNKKFGIAQIIENKNCSGLIGNTVTLSFEAKVSATTKLDNVKAAIVAWDGTADSVTSDIISAWGAEDTNPTLITNATYENTPANLNVTTSWAKYSVSGAVDTSGAKNIIIFIWSDVTDTTAGDFLYITNVQLELGSTASDFEHKSFGEELVLCQRYFQKSYAQGTPVGNASSANRYYYLIGGNNDTINKGGSYTLQTQMRALPTMTFYNDAGATGNLQSPALSPNVILLSTHHYTFYINTAAREMYGHHTAEAEL